MRGAADADSWATDGHKWLNVPYDCGVVAVREPDHHRAAWSTTKADIDRSADAIVTAARSELRG